MAATTAPKDSEDLLTQVQEEFDVPPDEVLTVSDLNGHINDVYEREPAIAGIYVLGEVTDYSTSSNGHVFFDLKDDESHVSCVCFNGAGAGHNGNDDTVDETGTDADSNGATVADLADGDQVLVHGTADYYKKQGSTSFKVKQVHPVGEGEYHVQIRKRKKKLQKEGLFDVEHKQDLPRFPERIGIVTSQHGAAVEDMIDTIHDRWPTVDIFVKHCAVQGEHAAADLVAGIAYFDEQTNSNEEHAVDVIVVGRGGGSFEDLDAFQSEQVARAVFDCGTPVVSGVGHRTDETIVGHVADHRGITPTAAGKAVVPRKQQVLRELEQLEDTLRDAHEQATKTEMKQRELELALTREQYYQATIIVLLLIIAVQFGVIVL